MKDKGKILRVISIGCILIIIFIIIFSFLSAMNYSPYRGYSLHPEGGWKKSENRNNIEYLYFGSFSDKERTARWNDMDIIIDNITKSVIDSYRPISSKGIINYEHRVGISNFNLTGRDINKDGKIDNDEYIEIRNLGIVSSNYHYKISLLYIPSGDALSEIEITI